MGKVTKSSSLGNITKHRISDKISVVTSGVYGLDNMTFTEAKHEAYLLAKRTHGYTYEDISEISGLKLNNLKRAFTDPGYHFSIPHVPVLCDALGNTLILEWQAARLNYDLLKIETDVTPSDLAACVSGFTHEAADVLGAHAESMMDNVLTLEEIDSMIKETTESVTSGTQLLGKLEAMRKELEDD